MTQKARKVTTLGHDVVSTDELEWNKYRKRPVVVSATRMDVPFMVETLEGWSQGQPGDWLIEGAPGELYPCNDAVFRATYGQVGIHRDSNSIVARSVGTFVQVGDVAVNMALVVEINFGEDFIYLYYRPDKDEHEIPVTLVGREKDAFLEWWEFQASKVDVQKVKVL